MAYSAAYLRDILLEQQDKRDTYEYAELYREYKRQEAIESSAVPSIDRSKLYASPAPKEEEPGFLDQIEEFAKGIPAGIISLGELGAIGAATLLEEENELKVRQGIQSLAAPLKEALSPDAGSEELVGRKFGEALGSFAGLGLTTLIPGAGIPLAAGLATGAGAGEASERARAAGATEAERSTAALKGAGVGLTELIPIAKLRSLREALGDNALRNGVERIKRAAIAGGFEGAQEVAAGVAQNAIQRGYDPTQDLVTAEAVEEGGYGAAVGATVQTLLDLALPKTRGAGVPEEIEGSTLQNLETEGVEVTDEDLDAVTGDETKRETKPKTITTKQYEARVANLMEAEKTEGNILTEEDAKKLVNESFLSENVTVKDKPKKKKGEEKKEDSTLQTLETTEGKGKEEVGEKTVLENIADLSKADTERVMAEYAKEEAAREAEIGKQKDREVATDETGTEVVTDETDTTTDQTGTDETVVTEEVKPKVVTKKVKPKVVTEETVVTEEVKLKDLYFARLKGVKDSVKEEDKAKVKTISEKDGLAVNKYFSRAARPADAIEGLAYDYALVQEGVGEKFTPKRTAKAVDERASKEETAFFEYTGGENAVEAYNWVQNNLSPDFRRQLDARVDSYRKQEQERISKDKTVEKEKLIQNYIRGEGGVANLTQRRIRDYKISPEEVAKAKVARANYLNREVSESTPYEIERRRIDQEGGEVNEFSPAQIAIAQKEYAQKSEEGQNEAVVRVELSDAKRQRLDTLKREYDEAAAAGDERRADRIDAQRKALLRAASEELLTKGALGKKTEATLDASVASNEAGPIIAAALNDRSNIYDITADAVVKSRRSVSPQALLALEEGKLADALNDMATTAPSQYLQNVSKRFAGLAGTTKVELVKDLKNASGKATSGTFNPQTNTIQLDQETGFNHHTILHETAHALGSAELNKSATPFAKQMNTLYNDTKDTLGTAYGAKNVQEFFAEGMGNESFRRELARIHSKGNPISALDRFVAIVKKLLHRVLGRGTYKAKTALSEFDSLADAIISPAPESRNAEILSMSATPDGASALATTLGNIQKRFKADPLSKKERSSLADGFSQLFSDSSMQLNNAVAGLRDIQGIVDLAEKISPTFGKLAKDLQIAIETQRGDMNKSDEIVDAILEKYLAPLAKTKKMNNLNNLIYNGDYGATITQVDPDITKNQAIVRYGGDSEALSAWYKQRKDWNALGKDGQAAYRATRNFYRKQYDNLKQTLTERIIGLAGEKEGQSVKAKLFKELFDNNELAVYFPLVRQGRYKVAYTIKAGSELIPNKKKRENEVYNMEIVSTEAEAIAYKKQLDARDDIVENSVEVIDTRAEAAQAARNRPSTGFVAEIIDQLDKAVSTKNAQEGTTPDQKQQRAQLQEEIISIFVNTLPETSFAKSLQRRKNVEGFEADTVLALRTKGYDIGRQTIRLQKSKDIMDIEDRINEEFKKKDDTLNKPLLVVTDELLKRASFARNPPPDMIAQTLNQGAFIYTIGFNPSSAIVNLSQIPLFVLPYLGGKYGMRSSTSAIGKAGKIVGESFEKFDVGFDNLFTVDKEGNYILKDKIAKELSAGDKKVYEELGTLAKVAIDRGQLTKSYLLDQLSLQKEAFKSGRERSGNFLRQGLDYITAVSASGFNLAERMNRQTTMVSAYNLEVARLKKEKNKSSLSATELEEAANEAIYITQETNGGSFIETSPRFAQRGLGRVALMYKSYGLRMYHTMFKSGVQLFKNAFPNTAEGRRLRTEAIKQLAGWHGSALILAGVQGVPLYGVASIAWNMLQGDDEEDFDTAVRTYLGEGWYKGAINKITGADVATRIRLTELLIQDNRYSGGTPEEIIGFHLGGPALSTGKRFFRAYQDFAKGEIERGIESTLPAGLANVYKASPFGRYQRDEGILTRRGDPIYDDISSGEMLGQFFGFAPNEYTKRQELNYIAKKIDRTVNEERSRLLKQIYLTTRVGDGEERNKIFEKIIKFNQKHPTAAISYDAVKRSMKQHAKTSAVMHNGILLSPNMREALLDRLYPTEE